MNRIKMAFKAAMAPAIVGVIGLVIGIVLFIAASVTSVTGLFIAGIFLLVFGIVMFVIAFNQGKAMMRAICPECKKLMGDTTETIRYEYVCTQYKENYDSSTHNFKDYTFVYTCTIECPHCGNTSTFEYKLNAKTESKADSEVDKYIKGILKLKA